MDDLSNQIGNLLSDPSVLDTLRSLIGSSDSSPAAAPVQEREASPPFGMLNMPNPEMLGMVMKLAPLLRSVNREDDSTRLLLALKPFMHEERSRRIDGAIRLLGILKILPVLKNSGIGLFPSGG